MFPKILITRLKFIFDELGSRYQETKDFLMREFIEYYEPENKRTKFIRFDTDSFAVGLGNASDEDNYFERSLENSGLSHLSRHDLDREFRDTRSDLQNQSKMYYYFSKCNSDAIRTSKHSCARGFGNLRKTAELKLNDLRQKSIEIVYLKSKQAGFEKVDLHGLYLDEAEEVVMIVLDKLAKMMLSGGGKYRSIEIITGRGSHSKGDAVLFPKISQYLKSQGHGVVGSRCGGKVTCTVRLR
jgi:hypothetical protein